MDSSKALGNLINNIKTSKILSANKQNIFAFVQELKAKNKAANTIIKYLYPLYQMNKREWINKPFNDLTKDDLKQVVAAVNEAEWSPKTKKNFKVTLKVFYRWLEGIDEPRFYPDRVRWISTSIAKREQKELTFDEIVTRDEVIKMADASFNPMHKALLWVLFESTSRPEECLNLKYSDIQFDDKGAVILLHGSKDKRPNRVITAAAYLKNWLQVHALKEQKDYPIWVTQFSKYRVKDIKWTQLGNSGANRILQILAARIGLTKRITMYSFRRGRITELAQSPKISSSLLKGIVGWTQNSTVSDKYIKFGHKDIDSAIIAADSVISSKTQKIDRALMRIKIKDQELYQRLKEFIKKDMSENQ